MRSLLFATLTLGLAASLTACRTAPDEEPIPLDTDTDTDTDSDTDSDTDTDAPFDCGDGPIGGEDWFGAFDKEDVIVSATSPYTVDAGIADVLAEAPAAGDTVELETPLRIDRAVVINTDYAPEGAMPLTFWFADQSGAMRTYDDYRQDDEIVVPEELTELPYGSIVSFDVLAIKNYEGELEITRANNYTLHEETDKVWVVDATDGSTVTYKDLGRANVKVYGEVTEVRSPCGTYNCYTYVAGESEYVFRTKKDYVMGDCVPIAGPLGTYRGEMQFNVTDFDWAGDVY